MDFSTEELVALGEVLAMPPLPSLGAEPLGDAEGGLRDAVLRTARRSLMARRVLTTDDDGTTEVVPPVAKLLEVMASPGLLGKATAERPSGREARIFAALPEVAIEDAVQAGGIHRLTPFPTEDFLARLLQFIGLEERGETRMPPISVSSPAFSECRKHVDAGAPADAVKALIDAGAPADAAEGFVSALSADPTTSRVTILHRPDATHIEGGEMAWIDGGAHGLWLLPIADEGDATDESETEPSVDMVEAPVDIEPTSAAHIGRTLLSYLPGSPDAEANDQ